MSFLEKIIKSFSHEEKSISPSNTKVSHVQKTKSTGDNTYFIDRNVNYSNKDPETLLKLVPQNSYALVLSDYYEKYFGFYSFFKTGIENRSLISLGAYADNFYDWFRGVMAEKENRIIVSGIIENSTRIKGTIIETTLNDYLYICDNHLTNFYRNAFDLLNRCKDKEDYLHFYSMWKKSIEKAVLEGRAFFYEYVEAIEPNHDDYIPVRMFLDYVNINNYLTPVGEAYSDEIQELICDALEKEYKETNVNFLSKYGSVKSLEGVVLLDTLCFYWPNNIYNTYISRNEILLSRRIQSGPVNSKETRKLIKKCENIIRKKSDLPLIGEGWISETILFKQIEAVFENTVVEKHASPLFLGKQHYDVYIPDYRIALEYQGIQHFEPIDIFGGKEGLAQTQERDRRKKELSESNGVTLIEVMPDYDIKVLVQKICDIAHCENPLNEKLLQQSYEIAYDTRDELKAGKKRLQNISKKKVKQYTPEEKRAAQNKLLSIKSRFNEGYWVKLWYISYQLSNADVLDLTPKDVESIIEDLKKEIPQLEEGDRNSCGEAFKRAINYYKKKEMYDEAIKLTQYSIDNKFSLPEGTKDFNDRLEELLKKKEEKEIKNASKGNETANTIIIATSSSNQFPEENSIRTKPNGIKSNSPTQLKEAARKELSSIKDRFNEGEWVKIWYKKYQISHADVLDLRPKDISDIIEELKNCLKDYNKAEQNGACDVIRLGIQYYKKKGMLEDAISLAKYAVDNSMKLPKGTKSFETHLVELRKKKGRNE